MYTEYGCCYLAKHIIDEGLYQASYSPASGEISLKNMYIGNRQRRSLVKSENRTKRNICGCRALLTQGNYTCRVAESLQKPLTLWAGQLASSDGAIGSFCVCRHCQMPPRAMILMETSGGHPVCLTRPSYSSPFLGNCAEVDGVAHGVWCGV